MSSGENKRKKRATAFIFSSEAGDTDGHFVGMMGLKKTQNKYSIQKILATQYTVGYYDYCDCMANWELQLASRDSILPHIANPGKDQNFKSEV